MKQGVALTTGWQSHRSRSSCCRRHKRVWGAPAAPHCARQRHSEGADIVAVDPLQSNESDRLRGQQIFRIEAARSAASSFLESLSPAECFGIENDRGRTTGRPAVPGCLVAAGDRPDAAIDRARSRRNVGRSSGSSSAVAQQLICDSRTRDHGARRCPRALKSTAECAARGSRGKPNQSGNCKRCPRHREVGLNATSHNAVKIANSRNSRPNNVLRGLATTAGAAGALDDAVDVGLRAAFQASATPRKVPPSSLAKLASFANSFDGTPRWRRRRRRPEKPDTVGTAHLRRKPSVRRTRCCAAAGTPSVTRLKLPSGLVVEQS